MTKAMAYKNLGIKSGTALTDIKKKYRQLMHRVHPDTEAFSTRAYDFTAQEINEAYEYLKKHTGIFQSGATTGKGSRRTASGTGTPSAWKDSPPNHAEWPGRINSIFWYASTYFSDILELSLYHPKNRSLKILIILQPIKSRITRENSTISEFVRKILCFIVIKNTFCSTFVIYHSCKHVSLLSLITSW